uniref:Uncharacterized protein n=1 Tax=Arundo donax TaxID=35708 RepID=A0A0A8YNW9_ARUDO
MDDERAIKGVYSDPLAILSDLQPLHVVRLEQQRQARSISVRRQAYHLVSLPAWRLVGHPHALRLASEYLQERLWLNTHVRGQELQQARY